MKSIRQDLTVQGLGGGGLARAVYMACMKASVENGDAPEYLVCSSRLSARPDLLEPIDRDLLTSLRVLYGLAKDNLGQTLKELQRDIRFYMPLTAFAMSIVQCDADR